MQRVALCSSPLLTVVIPPLKTETQSSSYQQFIFIRLITPCPHSIVYCLFTRVTGACHCSKQHSPRTYMSLAISYSNRVVPVALRSYTTQPRWISGHVLSKQIWFHRQTTRPIGGRCLRNSRQYDLQFVPHMCTY